FERLSAPNCLLALRFKLEGRSSRPRLFLFSRICFHISPFGKQKQEHFPAFVYRFAKQQHSFNSNK
ncbi:hypothetical protein, partial [Gardnerella vaginalis]|uniref:hypothetical protein n=1 Tax=Gardnerella vaginalis TaxID=2702 RepID=UPI001E29E7D1